MNTSPTSPQLRGVMVCLHQLHDFMPYIGWNAVGLTEHFLPLLQASGLNTLLIEYETMYPWSRPHENLTCQAAYTPNELANFEQAAAERGITIIPLVQTLGHVYHVLYHQEYRHLAELPEEWQQFCPQNPDVLKLIYELLDDVIRHHPHSKYLHLGGDECRLLGKCPKCQAVAQKLPGGIYGLYAQYYQQITNYVLSKGRIPILWHDIIVKHPELLTEFDERVLFHFWNYGDHSHGEMESPFQKLLKYIAPERIIGGPAARCEDSHGCILYSLELSMDNVDRMDDLIQQNHCLGSILTDWPDSGISFLTVAPLIYYHGIKLQKSLDRQEFKKEFARKFFGGDDPNFFSRLAGIYGEIPLARGFQTHLVSRLNRYKFRKFDCDAEIQAEIQAMSSRHSHAEFYKWCHHRTLCRQAIAECEKIVPQVQRHQREFRAFMLAIETCEFFLTATIGLCCYAWWQQGHREVGYQLTPELARQDLQYVLNKVKELQNSYQKLYAPICAPEHLKNFLAMLFPDELIAKIREQIQQTIQIPVE